MRFTRSKDGVERCMMRLTVRLTREQFAVVQRAAEDYTPHELLELEASLAVEGFIDETREQQRRADRKK